MLGMQSQIGENGTCRRQAVATGCTETKTEEPEVHSTFPCSEIITFCGLSAAALTNTQPDSKASENNNAK